MRTGWIRADKPHGSNVVGNDLLKTYNRGRVAAQSAQLTDVAEVKQSEDAYFPKTQGSGVQVPQAPQPPLSEDSVEITAEAKDKASNLQSKLEEMRNKYSTLLEELRRVNEMSEDLAESWRIKIKCLQIAMRIMAGDKVPEEDHHFLRENDAELYAKAISMKVEKEDPKEHDRLSEDKKDKDDADAEGAGGAPAHETVASGGGSAASGGDTGGDVSADVAEI